MSVPRICRRFLWLPFLPAVLLASCAGLQIQFPEDPVAVLLAGGAEKPAALAVFPPDFMVSLFAGDVFAQAAEESPQAAQMLDFLSDLFSRSDAVFAAFFSGGESGVSSCRILASGNFPDMLLRFSMHSSDAWERAGSGAERWYTGRFGSAGVGVALPNSDLLAAEIRFPDDGQAGNSETSAMRALLRALRESPPADTVSPAVSGTFGFAVHSMNSRASGVPFSFFIPDLPVFFESAFADCALPGAGEIAASGLQLPLTTFGLYVSENPSPETPPDGAYRLLIETEASSSRFALPAELFLRMAFPGQSVTREDAHFFVETEISREQAALAVLSMFLLPYMGM